MPVEPMVALRWLHVLAGAAWFGEVLVINILVSGLRNADASEHDYLYGHLLPNLFKLATILSLTAVLSGTALVHTHLGGDWAQLFRSERWNVAIMVGGGLAWAMTFFHLFIERAIARRSGFDPRDSPTAMARMHVVLSIIPRGALLVLTAVMVSMMIAAHGL